MGCIGIIDYGMGNLYSVANACAYLGIEAFISGDTEKLSRADGLILPGVGALPDAMDVLRSRGLDAFIKEAVEKTPLLGICLGMQLLFDEGEEVRPTKALGLIPGKVVKLSAYRQDPKTYQIPHMGWNKLEIVKENSPLVKTMEGNGHVYFVHSYKGVVENREDLIASVGYGEEIAAIVGRGNVYGTQFHPEKSERVGLGILKNFGAML